MESYGANSKVDLGSRNINAEEELSMANSHQQSQQIATNPHSQSQQQQNTSPLYEELKMIAGNPDYIGSLQVVEVMFNKIVNVIELRHVHNLIELTLIGTLTTSLQGIETQGHSLETLSVTNCNLSRIEPYFLKLINLRHLHLGENQITAIENLQQQGIDNTLSVSNNVLYYESLLTFQLYSVRKTISVQQLDKAIGGFGQQFGFKRVASAGQQIEKGGKHQQISQPENFIPLSKSFTKYLLSFQIMNFINPIESLDAVSEIGQLPNLSQLSFACEHFDSCPVTELPGYKSYVLSTIQAKDKLQTLDSQYLDQQEFQIAQNEFMEQINFQQKIPMMIQLQ